MGSVNSGVVFLGGFGVAARNRWSRSNSGVVSFFKGRFVIGIRSIARVLRAEISDVP